MNRRAFLSFLGLAPSAPLFTFRRPTAEAAKLGCSGFIVTDSALSAVDLARLSSAWPSLKASDLTHLASRTFTIDEICILRSPT